MSYFDRESEVLKLKRRVISEVIPSPCITTVKACRSVVLKISYFDVKLLSKGPWGVAYNFHHILKLDNFLLTGQNNNILFPY